MDGIEKFVTRRLVAGRAVGNPRKRRRAKPAKKMKMARDLSCPIFVPGAQ